MGNMSIGGWIGGCVSFYEDSNEGRGGEMTNNDWKSGEYEIKPEERK